MSVYVLGVYKCVLGCVYECVCWGVYMTVWGLWGCINVCVLGCARGFVCVEGMSVSVSVLGVCIRIVYWGVFECVCVGVCVGCVGVCV